MDNSKTNDAKMPNKKVIIIGLVVVLLIVAVALIVNSGKKSANNTANNNNSGSNVADTQATPDAGTATAPTPAPDQVVPAGARVEVTGGNAITKDNVVITKTGEVAKNDAVPMSPSAPQQTAPIAKAQVPSTAIKLDVSAAGFAPNSFSVKAGAPVTFSVSSADGLTHVFMFDDNALAAVAIGIGPSETRAITFNAPTKAGEYTFRCDVPGHSGRGETGKMIVK